MRRIFIIFHDLLFFLYALVSKVINLLFIFNKTLLHPNTKKKIIIIANGPSLKKDIQKIIKKKKSYEIYALNYFALTKEFVKIKPNFYFVADPIFWRSDINKNFKKDNKNLYNNLSDVNWNMHLFCPKEGLKFVSNKLSSNRFITVKIINSRSFDFKSEKLNVFSLYHEITTPIFNNVLILALWHAISRKLKLIEIYGADFSGFKDLVVDQTSNRLYSSPKHFYKNTKAQKNSHLKYLSQPPKKIHSRLYQVWVSFYQIYLLSIVARKHGIRLFNCSKNSYLDSIDRPKL